jgi:hypothetical protein
MSLELQHRHLTDNPYDRDEAREIIEAIEKMAPRDLLNLLAMDEKDEQWEKTLKLTVKYTHFNYESPKAQKHEGEMRRIVGRDKIWESQLLKARVFHYLRAYTLEAIIALKKEQQTEKSTVPNVPRKTEKILEFA